MKRFIINEEVRGFLKSMVGSNISSIDIGDSEKEFNRSYGKMRINFNDGSLDVNNIESPTDILGEMDDISFFTFEMNNKDHFRPYMDEKASQIKIDEKIIDISIITDKIDIDGKYELEFDEAIIVKTPQNSWMIYREWQYSELIHITNNKGYDEVYPICDVIENWNNYGEYNVKVVRTETSLTKE